MALTVVIDGDGSGKQMERISQKYGVVCGTITFDDDYAIGGESLSGITDYMRNQSASQVSVLKDFHITLPNGFLAEIDYTAGAEKIKVLNDHVPPIVFEEKFDADADTATLRWPAAHIEYVATEATPLAVIFGGLTPASGQVAAVMGFNSTTGVLTPGSKTTLTFVAGEGSATTYCSYVTQSWKEVADNMSSACMTAGAETWGDGLVFTAGTPDRCQLGVDIIAMTCMCWNTNGGGAISTFELLKDAGAPAATLEAEIDFVKATDLGEVNFYATDAVDGAGDVVYFQYIKKPSSGFINERHMNAEIADASDQLVFTDNPLLYASCGQIPMETSDEKCYLTSVADTVLDNQGNFATYAVAPNGSGTCAITSNTAVDTDYFPSWIRGNIAEIETQAIEVESADYSGWGAIRFTAIGFINQ